VRVVPGRWADVASDTGHLCLDLVATGGN
jgi:hypothetical protein